jgi:hypothetical protein
MNKALLKKTDFTLVALVACFLAFTGILFLSQTITPFFFAGYISPNVEYLRAFAVKAAAGLLPYRDFAVEYPPLGALWLCAFAPFSGTESGFINAFTIASIAVSVAGLLGAIRLAELTAAEGAAPRRRIAAAALYTAAIVAAGPTGLASIDYVPMALTVWAFAALAGKRHALAAALLAAATAAKIYPAILVPMFLYEAYRQSGRAAAIRSAAVFAGIVAAVFALAFAAAPEGFAASFAYHFHRGIEVGSSYAAALFALKYAGLKVAVVSGYGGWNVAAGRASAFAARVSPLVLFLLVARPYGRLVRVIQRRPPETGEQSEKSFRRALGVSGAATAAFIIGFKVGSPQFLIWLIPFIVQFSLAPRGLPAFALFAAAGLASQWVYPAHMQSLIGGQSSAAVAALCIKWLSLIGVFAIFIHSVELPEKTTDHTDRRLSSVTIS